MSRIVHDLIAELRLGRIRTVAFVVRGDVRWTLPLYELAIATARRGWSIGIVDARYWFVTPEPVPLAGFGSAARAAVSARLEPEGITFVGSTFADLRPGRRVARSPRRVHRGRSCRDAWRERGHHHYRLRRAVRHPSAGGPAMKRSMRIVVVGGSGLIGDRS